MAKPTMTIVIEAGTPRMSWCDGCLTSSRYEVDLFILGAVGLSTLGTAHGCERCGPDVIADHDDGPSGGQE